jgi:alpha-galactosidase
MPKNLRILIPFLSVLLSVASIHAADYSAFIRTPAAPATPRINGPNVFGVRPNSPFLYTIPATGDRPMTFSVKKLPRGLSVDAVTGRITGSLARPGEYKVVLRAENARGTNEKKFRIAARRQTAANSSVFFRWRRSAETPLRQSRAT